MKLQMQDQSKRMEMIDTRKETTDILMKMLIAFFIFAAIATGFTIASIKEAEAANYKSNNDLACVSSDSLISDDMQDYIVTYGNGESFEEGDLQ